MYTEYEEKKGFPIRDFLIKLVLIIVFVLLLLWLLPIPNMKGINNTIFNANVQTMKDAAITYFTDERLPKEVGDKVTLTLKEMLDMKLLLPFTDKNGDTCDVNKSYVTLEKKETEYLMTVHLKCKGQEDEIVVHLGCYTYCTSAICEKQDEEEVAVVTGPSCTLMVSSGKAGENGWYLGDVSVKFKSKSTTSGAKITKYGIGLSSNYDGKNTYKVTKDGVTKVYGYVQDSNGKTAVCSIDIKKDTVEPACNLTVLSGSTSANGSYITDVVVGFSSKTDATSGVAKFGLSTSSKAEYNNKTSYTINKNGTTKVYGYVKDTAGHTKTCNITVDRNATSKASVPSCSLEVTSGTVGNNGWYTSNVVVGFKNKSTTNGASIASFGIGTSQTYANNTSYTINTDGTTVLKGYVKDSNGNTATCSITVKRDATKPNCTLAILSGTKNNSGNYTTDVTVGYATKSDATSGMNSYGLAAGSNPIYNGTDKLTITNNGTHTVKGYVKDNAGNVNTCEVVFTKVALAYEYEYTKDVYTTKVGDAIYANKLVETTSVSTQTCSGYSYYRLQNNTTTTYAIKVGETWQYEGLVSLASSPSDTLAVKYEFVGMDWDRCGDSCTTTPYKVWKRYTRTVSTVTASDTITTNGGVTIKCDSYTDTPIVVYNNFEYIAGYEQVKVLTKDTKWSSYNDSILLNQGYTMTGNKRLAG